jgi:prepilin-type N-terminal cleavage/methylation domain-containing protein
MDSGCGKARRRAFTLVELVTVIAILGILVAVMLGGMKGIQDYAARSSTEATIRAVETGLRKYFDDWQKYPWPASGGGTLTGAVYPVRFRPAPTSTYDAEATLYAALMMEWRHGPYFAPSSENTKVIKDSQGEYTVIVDGWGRVIDYKAPRDESQPPRLISDGANPDDPRDDMSNY